MSLISNLNFLATILSFGSISFALSGLGVKLGKFTSSPHFLGFKYISDSPDIKDKLYDAIVKINENIKKDVAPSWAKEKGTLEKWCYGHQKSPRYWEEASQYCLIRNNVWHKLIEKGVELKDDITKKIEEQVQTQSSGEGAATTRTEEKCTYEVLNNFADDDSHPNYLIGKKLCSKTSSTNTEVS